MLFALVLIAPACAGAGSLLSGYGGPGEGNQEILGAALLGGPTGGGGGAGTGGGGSSAGVTGAGASEARSDGADKQPRHTGSKGAGARTSTQGTSKAGAPAYPATVSQPYIETRSVGTPTLGITGDDLVYLLIALAVLVMTAGFTRRLAVRRPG